MRLFNASRFAKRQASLMALGFTCSWGNMKAFATLLWYLVIVSLLGCTPTTPRLPADLPKARITIADRSQDGVLGTFCWKGMCADSRLESPMYALLAEQSFEMVVSITAWPEIHSIGYCAMVIDDSMISAKYPESQSVTWEPVEECKLKPILSSKSQSVPVKLTAGQYFVGIGSWWVGGGDAFFGFRVDVLP